MIATEIQFLLITKSPLADIIKDKSLADQVVIGLVVYDSYLQYCEAQSIDAAKSKSYSAFCKAADWKILYESATDSNFTKFQKKLKIQVDKINFLW